jgi:hypothetical protein
MWLFNCTHEAKWTPFKTHYSSEKLVAPGFEHGISGSVARNSDHYAAEAVTHKSKRNGKVAKLSLWLINQAPCREDVQVSWHIATILLISAADTCDYSAASKATLVAGKEPLVPIQVPVWTLQGTATPQPSLTYQSKLIEMQVASRYGQ